MDFKLLALDIDGTLIAAEETICPQIVDAVAAAEAAGMRVVLTTGRTLDQTVGIWRQLRLQPTYEPLVLASGAMVCEPDTGRTLYQKSIALDVARPFCRALTDAGHTAMAFVDPWRHGLQYVLCEGEDADTLRRKWFSKTQPTVRWVRELEDVPEMPRPLRLSAIAPDRTQAETLASMLTEHFGGELCVNTIYVPASDVMIVEATAKTADKWTALMYIAQGVLIRPGEIVAVGDDTNDLSMIGSAGLGVAMGHAPQCVRDAAGHVVTDLVEFLHQLVDGRFHPA